MIKWILTIMVLGVSLCFVAPVALDNDPDQDLLVKGFNEELLNQLVFDLINEKRVAKGLDSLDYTASLAVVAKKHQSALEFRRFTNKDKVEAKVEKRLAQETKKAGFKGKLVLPIAAQWDAINYERDEDYFYNKLDTETDFHLFYGVKPKKRDKNKDRDEIPKHSYDSFAKAMLDNLDSKNKDKLYSKSYKWIGMNFQWYYKSLNKRTIPQMKGIFIVGGYQTAGMWE